MVKSLKSDSRKKKIQPYISADLYDRFKGYAKKSRTTASGVIEEALTQYLDESYDAAAILKRLTSLESRGKRLERDSRILMEVMLLFIKVWYAHTPEIAESEKETARRAGKERYDTFIDAVAQILKGEGSVFSDLVKENVSDQEALRKIIEGVKEQS